MLQNKLKIGENYFIRDLEMGYYPIFSYELNRRVKNKEACVVTVSGEAGVGKSYMAIQLARNVDKRFGIDQIVFTYGDYTTELKRFKHGLPIVFDEPSYAMGKREWYKQINQALVKTIESQRFLVRPLIIPIININLLDKTLRDFLVIFQVYVYRRGRAVVYRLQASQYEDKLYRHFVCRLEYPPLDFDKCSYGIKDSCLDCKDIDVCNLLRAKYERKKKAIQMMRYEQDEEQSKVRESKELTDAQLYSMIKPYLNECKEDDKVIAIRLRALFITKLGIKIGHNKAYALKTLIEFKEDDNKKESKTLSLPNSL